MLTMKNLSRRSRKRSTTGKENDQVLTQISRTLSCISAKNIRRLVNSNKWEKSDCSGKRKKGNEQKIFWNRFSKRIKLVLTSFLGLLRTWKFLVYKTSSCPLSWWLKRRGVTWSSCTGFLKLLSKNLVFLQTVSQTQSEYYGKFIVVILRLLIVSKYYEFKTQNAEQSWALCKLVKNAKAIKLVRPTVPKSVNYFKVN